MRENNKGTEQEQLIAAEFIARHWTANSGIANVLLVQDSSGALCLNIQVIDEASKNKLKDVEAEGIASISVTVNATVTVDPAHIRLRNLIAAHRRVMSACGYDSPQAIKFRKEHAECPLFTDIATLGRNIMEVRALEEGQAESDD